MTVATYRNDRLYPRIVRAVESILQNSKVVAPVEVLVEMGLLKRERLEDWRHGRVPYLERVVDCNLMRLSRLLRVFRFLLVLRPSKASRALLRRRHGSRSHRDALQPDEVLAILRP